MRMLAPRFHELMVIHIWARRPFTSMQNTGKWYHMRATVKGMDARLTPEEIARWHSSAGAADAHTYRAMSNRIRDSAQSPKHIDRHAFTEGAVYKAVKKTVEAMEQAGPARAQAKTTSATAGTDLKLAQPYQTANVAGQRALLD